MKNILIADAGSTKIDWALTDSEGKVQRYSTEGLNALLSDGASMAESFRGHAVAMGDPSDIDTIYYYGAGCATPAICRKTEEALRAAFPGADAMVTTDLLAAARSLFGNNPGIACILGTGSNSGLYNGSVITHNVPSLGFILGDEGSGATLGKRLVSDAFKGQIPALVKEKFLSAYNLTLPEILDKIYRSPNPNRFLASLVPFLSENIWNPYVYSLVRQELTLFLTRNVLMYPGVRSTKTGFTGSIAYVFADILREAAGKQGIDVTRITKSPMDGLIEYHTSLS